MRLAGGRKPQRTPAAALDGQGARLDLAMLCRPPHPNALLIGLSETARAAISTILSDLPQPVAESDSSSISGALSSAARTIIIWNVDRLDAPQQRRLLEFIERSGAAVQIISVSTTELFDRVERGEFLDALYYRLNVIRIEVDAI